MTFALDGYTDIRDGVNALNGTLEFDTDVFEEVSGEDFETLNSWEQMFYNTKNGQFVLINRAGTMEGQEVFSLRLTAKQSLPAKEAYITVKEISVSEGNEDLFPADGSLKIDLITAEGPAGNENGDPAGDRPDSDPSQIQTGESGGNEPEGKTEGNDETEAEELGLGSVHAGACRA